MCLLVLSSPNNMLCGTMSQRLLLKAGRNWANVDSLETIPCSGVTKLKQPHLERLIDPEPEYYTKFSSSRRREPLRATSSYQRFQTIAQSCILTRRMECRFSASNTLSSKASRFAAWAIHPLATEKTSFRMVTVSASLEIPVAH